MLLESERSWGRSFSGKKKTLQGGAMQGRSAIFVRVLIASGGGED